MKMNFDDAKRKQKYASTIGGVFGAAAIADLWKVHYSKLLNLNHSDAENVSFTDFAVSNSHWSSFFCSYDEVNTLLLNNLLRKLSWIRTNMR